MSLSPAFWPATLSSIGVSLVSLIGVVTLPFRGEGLRKATFVLVSLAAGALVGDAVIHLLPEIYRDPAIPLGGAFWILVGLSSAFCFEKFLRWKQGHGLHGHAIKPVARLLIVSDGLHNLVDGLLIGGSFLTSPGIGLATTAAVALHELPHELGDFAVLLDGGYTWERALLFNFLSSLIAVAGTLLAFVFEWGLRQFPGIALGVTAGSFMYIAGANLTPELQKESSPSKSLIQIAALGAGVCLMWILKRVA